jgi:UPF0755 protein
VSGPAGSRPGRHASPDTDAGIDRAAAELLAAWASDRRAAAAAAEAASGSRPSELRTSELRNSELRTAEMRALPVMPPRASSARSDSAQSDSARSDTARSDDPRSDTPRSDSSRSDSSRSDTARSDTDRPTDGRPAARPAGARPAGARPAGARPAGGRSAIARPAPDRVSPAPWTTVGARPAPGRDLEGDLDREQEAFADDATAPGIPSGASRPLLGGRRVTDAGAGTALAAPSVPDAPAWPSPSPLAAALAAIDARHAADHEDDDEPTTAEHPPLHDWDDDSRPGVFDVTGGLEVVVADEHHDHHHDHDHHDGDHHDDSHPGGGGGGGRRGGGRRGGGASRRRRPVAVLLSVAVLLGLVAGIVFGGQALLRAINPAAEDYAGVGTGTVDIRINSGDSLRTIAATLVESDVIASTGPFLDAAEANTAATGIQPGVYSMRSQMSGQSALDLLLHPATRLVTRVTVPEGQTVAQVLERLAESTGTPLADLQAVAAAPAELGLPPYANGMLEGFLFPATYDIEPETTPADMLRPMVARTVQVLDELQIPVEQRLTALAEASIVQAESRTAEQMGMVARVLENRLAEGMPLQMDSTVNYANGKSGITTTPEDRANPSPYNTYANPGLPPGAINNPGEEALRAVLNPTPGPWRFFVVVDPPSGDTRFAETAEEHAANVKLFQQWLQENPGG